MKSGCALKKKLKLPTCIVRLIIYLVKTKMLLNCLYKCQCSLLFLGKLVNYSRLSGLQKNNFQSMISLSQSLI